MNTLYYLYLKYSLRSVCHNKVPENKQMNHVYLMSHNTNTEGSETQSTYAIHTI